MSLRSRDSLRLADQLNSEWRSTGLNFRIMLVGESGLGKTTFTRALLRPYVPDHELDQATSHDGSLDGPLRARTTRYTTPNVHMREYTSLHLLLPLANRPCKCSPSLHVLVCFL